MVVRRLLLRAFGIRDDPPRRDPLATAHCPLCGQGVTFSSGWWRSEADMWREAYAKDHITADTLAEKLLALEVEDDA